MQTTKTQRIDLSAWLLGIEVIGETYGESFEDQKKRLLKQLTRFFNHTGVLIAQEAETGHLYTNAHLIEADKNPSPISWDDETICITTKGKTFEWAFNEGRISIVVSDDVVSIIHDTDDGSLVTQFVRW